MSKRAFENIAEGLEEAIRIARGEARPARLHVPAEIDVKALRHRTSLSQAAFASAYGFSLTQIRDWEQGRSRPVQSDRAYLTLIGSDPEWVMKALAVAHRREGAKKVA